MERNIVIIPTYNEKENVASITRAVLALADPCFEVLIIDDGSPDGTAAIVKELMAGECAGRLHLIERSGKLGLGTAYITGFKWALAQGYDYIFEMDADFSHAPADLPRLWSACAREGYDVAVGSRYVSGVNVVNWPMGRVLMSYFASQYVRFITRVDIHDTTAGFVCYHRSVLETIELDKVRFKGYAFQIEMKFTAVQCGFKLKEVPVVFVNRELGTSKMSGGIFSEALFGVMRLRWDGWFRRYPKRVLATTLAVMMSLTGVDAQQVIKLWPDGLPNSNGIDITQPFDAKTNNFEPTITISLPPADKANRKAVVCCPGGAYSHLASGHEGMEWAEFFNSRGYAFAMLTYRMPHGVTAVPISDARQALRVVRAHAEEWNIDARQVGIMGSSAGGHLASTIATHSSADEAPAFQILFYPVISMLPGVTHQGSHDNLLGQNATPDDEREYCNELHVTPSTPPAILLLSADDAAVPPANAIAYYNALRQNNVSAALHIYPTGGHGWGYRSSFAHHDEMIANLDAWLR